MYIVFVLWVFTYDYEGIDEFKFKHILGYLCGLKERGINAILGLSPLG